MGAFLPLHNVAHTLIVHRLLAAIVQEGVELERIVFSHVVHNAHGGILLHIAIDGSRLGSNNELVVSKMSRRPRAYAHAYSRSHHGAGAECREKIKSRSCFQMLGIPRSRKNKAQSDPGISPPALS
jgi:hypothetical protein